MENAVEKAIRILGPSVFEASMKTGIPPATLYKWIEAKRIKDGRRAVQVSRATGGQVTVEELVGYTEESPNGGTRRSSATSPAIGNGSSDSAPTDGAFSPLIPAPAEALAA
jgi:DNA-binding transcriptional regulator YdaS (Cro superfamily)